MPADSPRQGPGALVAVAGPPLPTAASLALASAQDVFRLRRGAQRAAAALGLEQQDQVRLATALSELGRDRLGRGPGTVSFRSESGEQPTLVVTLEWDRGQPTPEVLELVSRIVAIEHTSDGARGRVSIRQPLPANGLMADDMDDRLVRCLVQPDATTEADFLRAQTRDLVATLEETRAQREDLRRLNRELEETNQGVLALYSELAKELETTNIGVLALHSELDEKSRQIREASEAKTRFWTNISHELRAPINSVVALARLLLDAGSEPVSAEQRQQIKLIEASGQTVLSLVSDLLDVVKAESGLLDVERGPVDLRLLVTQLSATFEGTYGGKGVCLVTPDLRDLPTVITDEKLLTHVLRNLMSNACKFTDEGEVRLDVAVTEDGPSPSLHVTITDTGVGIPAAEIGRVFEEFYQVRGPHQSGHAGTGLGLPYARTLTELLGGTIKLTSTPGVGTRVEVLLPVHGQGDHGDETGGGTQ
ncbi:sensor histidine kinase [Streptomyces longisporoflavus]|uniref:sensor histidine kinase n=1 Tax=Streptomyces longisporoflavus TaxID=28044 RepID=UPI00167C4BB2|nr:HAMP domain-containing sensor histidine kinase [Streptomyces longisporoflavus]GGV41370.1 sensor histidine kinase [Streptomyces longisporoflavus]